MKIKVCGMRHMDNIIAVAALRTDYIGFIFYPKSKRLVNSQILEKLSEVDIDAQKVGVFVNQSLDDTRVAIRRYQLDAVQLHGDETPEMVRALKTDGCTVIKAFQISEAFDWTELDRYYDATDFFLFDTANANYGGSGQKFNWNLLDNYKFDKPFFLSGGISLEDAEAVKELNLPQLYAVDLNSKFEIEPGLKDTYTLSKFINQINESKLSSR